MITASTLLENRRNGIPFRIVLCQHNGGGRTCRHGDRCRFIHSISDAGSLVGSQIDENILKFATDPARNTAFIPPPPPLPPPQSEPPPLPPPQSEETNQTRELFGANRSSKRPRELDSDNTFAVDKAIAEALQLEYSKIANSIRDNPGSEDHNSGVQRLREQVCILNARLARRSRCIVCMDNSVDVGFLHKDSMHVCACKECALKIQQSTNSCPMCRQSIERVVQNIHRGGDEDDQETPSDAPPALPPRPTSAWGQIFDKLAERDKNEANLVVTSPNNLYSASSGKDGPISVWDMATGQEFRNLNVGGPIRSLVFSPSQAWLCVAVECYIQVWDYHSDVLKFTLDSGYPYHFQGIYCLSLFWNTSGTALYSGWSDNKLRFWKELHRKSTMRKELCL